MATRSATNAGATLRLAKAGDVLVLARALARAFDQDPFINWVVRQDERRVLRMEWAFEVMLRRMSSELKETHTNTELGGAAVWRRPGELKLPLAQQLALLPAFARGMGWGRVPGFYARHGFEVVDVVARAAWPKLWLMRREPGAAAQRRV